MSIYFKFFELKINNKFDRQSYLQISIKNVGIINKILRISSKFSIIDSFNKNNEIKYMFII